MSERGGRSQPTSECLVDRGHSQRFVASILTQNPRAPSPGRVGNAILHCFVKVVFTDHAPDVHGASGGRRVQLNGQHEQLNARLSFVQRGVAAVAMAIRRKRAGEWQVW